MKSISGTENLIKWRIHNCYTGGTVSKSNRKIVQKGKIDPPNSKYMNTRLPDLVRTLQWNVTGINQFYGTKPPVVKWRGNETDVWE